VRGAVARAQFFALIASRPYRTGAAFISRKTIILPP